MKNLLNNMQIQFQNYYCLNFGFNVHLLTQLIKSINIK